MVTTSSKVGNVCKHNESNARLKTSLATLSDEMFQEISTHLSESRDVRAFQKVLVRMDIHALDHLVPVLDRIDGYLIENVQREANLQKFVQAASYGDLPALQWLHSVIRKDGPHVYRAFEQAAVYNKLEVAKWLHLTYGLTLEHVRGNGNYVLRMAARGGLLLILQWLYETFGLTPQDARCQQNEPLRLACGNGNLNTAKWLVSTFGLTAEDAKAVYNHTFLWTRSSRHKKITRWLKATFGITQDGV